jgi:hypothetical protein
VVVQLVEPLEPEHEPINFNKIKAIRINEPEREPKMSRIWRDWQNAEPDKTDINPTDPNVL